MRKNKDLCKASRRNVIRILILGWIFTIFLIRYPISPNLLATDNSIQFMKDNEKDIADATISDSNATRPYNDNIWTNMSPFISPSARRSSAMTFDSRHENYILFGGGESSPLYYTNDTWRYNYNTNIWSNVMPLESPSARIEHSMVYDNESNRVIMFGGFNSSLDFNDTWGYDPDLNLWTNMSPKVHPPVLPGSMIYDSKNDRVILFGWGKFQSETWSYDYNTNNWVNLTPTKNPPNRVLHAITYDSKSNHIILFGGMVGSNVECLGDTWVYDYDSNVWTNITPPIGPSPRLAHSLSYDSESDRIVLFGGECNGNFYDDTWVFDSNTNTWTNMNPIIHPSSRELYSMVYDSPHDRIILFGGNPNNNETWAYRLDGSPWPDVYSPHITSSGPSDSSKNVSITTKIELRWNESMDQTSAQSAFISFPSIPCKWSWSGLNQTCAPSSPLLKNTSYIITISTIVKDITGNRMKDPYQFSFTTEGVPIPTPPRIISTGPTNGSIDVPTNTTIAVTFDKSMDRQSTEASISSSPLITGGFTWSPGDAQVRLNSSVPLSFDTSYTIGIGTTAKSKDGVNLVDPYSFTFKTVAKPPEPPVIIKTIPVNNSVNVSLNSSISIEFSESMNRSTTESSIFSTPSISFTTSWSSNDTTLTVLPARPFNASTTYTVTISSTAESIKGLNLKSDHTFIFTTIRVQTPSTPSTDNTALIIGAGVGALAIAIGLAGIILFESAAYALAFILVPLYLRFKKDKILSGFLRGRIFEFISQNPGAHLRMIKNELGIELGVLRYHLDILMKASLIRSERNSNLKRFYCIAKGKTISSKQLKELDRPSGMSGSEDLSDIQKKILAELESEPGLTVKLLSKRLNLSRQIARYNLRRLSEMKLIAPRLSEVGIKYFKSM